MRKTLEDKIVKYVKDWTIRQHMNNEVHQYCRIVDYYINEQKMTIGEAHYCAKNKFKKLYNEVPDLPKESN